MLVRSAIKSNNEYGVFIIINYKISLVEPHSNTGSMQTKYHNQQNENMCSRLL